MIKETIEKLRQELAKEKIDGYYIPRTDEYQGEYTAPYAQRLKLVTNFSGSNGFVLVFKDKALFFTDGRYTTQAELELDSSIFSIHNLKDFKTFPWDKYGLEKASLGVDPMLCTKSTLSMFSNFEIKKISGNLVDKVWEDQPEAPTSEVFLYNEKYAGMPNSEKLEIIRKEMLTHKADYLILTMSDSICWLLNIRANDVEFMPIMQGYMIISHKSAHVFTRMQRVPEKVKKSLSKLVEFHEEAEIFNKASELKGRVMYDATTCPLAIIEAIHSKAELINKDDPCQLIKAKKNATEIEWAHACHIADGIALCEAFAEIEHKISNNDNIDECDIDDILLSYRQKDRGFFSRSFSTIAGYQSNGAIIHYRPQKETCKNIKKEGLLLIDSGAQYYGCTTDVTRVLACGEPTREQITRYTQVLKGHLDLAMCMFPKGTSGMNLDAIARYSLWQDKCDYAHGTGHGVSAFLSVHEGPQRINAASSSVALEPGMIISNEPGFYKVSEYGIRIENLIYVKDAGDGFFKFITLTMVPYERRLIDVSMLNHAQISFIRSYYEQIKKHIYPNLSPQGQAWTKRQMSFFLAE